MVQACERLEYTQDHTLVLSTSYHYRNKPGIYIYISSWSKHAKDWNTPKTMIP